MRTLVIDTATRACSVALFFDGQLIESHYEVIGRGHAERLVPLIAELPDRGRSDQILVNVGLGSFTGIRVGVAAARALSLAWGASVSGYGCLTLVAAMARAGRSVSVDVVMAGGHGEYFFQSFDESGSATSQAASLSPLMIEARSNADVVAGDFAADMRTLFGNRSIVEVLPDAASWHLIADSAPLAASPVYGRAPDAKMPTGIVV